MPPNRHPPREGHRAGHAWENGVSKTKEQALRTTQLGRDRCLHTSPRAACRRKWNSSDQHQHPCAYEETASRMAGEDEDGHHSQSQTGGGGVAAGRDGKSSALLSCNASWAEPDKRQREEP